MDLSIIIPAFNEAENLPGLLDELALFVDKAPCRVEVIVVDDGSGDDTGRLIGERAAPCSWLRPLANPGPHGMGAALKLGTAEAVYPLVAWVMGDKSDNLADLWLMRERLIDGASLVVASRAAAGGSYGNLIGLKEMGSRGFSLVASTLLGLPVRDITNAFRAFRKEDFATIDLRRNDFAISPEQVVSAARKGLHIEEVPTTYYYRQKGLSSFKIFKMGLIYCRVALLTRFRRS